MKRDTDYGLLCEQIKSFAEEDPHWLPLLSNVSALIMETLPDLNWAGFYLLRGDTLVLGPFQGKPACIHIPAGRGVCGTAAAERRTVRVENVHEFPGHIACDCASNSEIVVPIFARGGAEAGAGAETAAAGTKDAAAGKRSVIGVLDIDSPLIGRFSEEDRTGLEAAVRTLSEVTAWSAELFGG